VWGTLQLPYASVEAYRKRIAERPEGHYQLVAAVDGEVVGAIGLHPMSNVRLRHTGSIGMAVRDDWQGKGVGSALMRDVLSLADNWLNLKRVELEVYTDNPAAIALYRKFGFAHEGIKRAYAFREGQYVDAHMMARVR
jgi:L-phenylalanine/L-methionine N-acetyltransferase